MNKTKRNYILFMMILNVIFWSITFLLRHYKVDSNIVLHIEGIELATLGVILFYNLVFKEDLFYSIIPLFFAPFIFSKGFDALTVPTYLISSLGIVILGFICRLFTRPFKFKFGKMFFGLLAIGISIILGGIFIQSQYSLIQLLVGFLVCTLILLIYSYFVSSNIDFDFKLIAYLMTMLGIMIVLEEAIYIFTQENFTATITKINIHLGWGGKNNFSLMLLFTIPFTFYLMLKENNKYNMIFYQVAIILQTGGIFISYSRGCILISLFGSLFYLLFTYYYFRKDKTKLIITTSVLVVAAVGIVTLLIALELYGIKILSAINKLILDGFNFSGMNGRLPIYKKFFELWSKQPIFGYGILYPNTLEGHVDVGINAYQWAHSTLLQALFTGGIVGFVAMVYHLFEKYYLIIRNMNLEKLTLLMGYLLSGIYGMFDVSYYYINYMIVLIIIFVVSEKYIDNMPYVEKLNNKL